LLKTCLFSLEDNNICVGERESAHAIIHCLDDPTNKDLIDLMNSAVYPIQSIRTIWAFCSQAPQYEERVAKEVAIANNIIFCESSIEKFEESHFVALVLSLKDFFSVRDRPNAGIYLKRYTWALSNLRYLQRLYTNLGVLRSKDPNSISTPEAYENIPCSLIEFELPSESYDRVLKCTYDQIKLWNLVSQDHEWQLNAIKGYPSP